MKLYVHYFSIHIKSIMQYKTSFFFTAIGQFLTSFNVLLGIYFMHLRFGDVNGFTYSEVLLCYSVVLISFSLAECFFRAFDSFSSLISNGEFDRILVRPKGIILQVIASKIELTRVGRLLQALVMMAYALSNTEILWTPIKVLTLFLMIIGGIGVFSGLFILYSAICFFTLEGLEFMNIFTDGAREHGKYPLSIYGNGVLKFCTFVIPYALFQYYPFLYLIGKEDRILYCIFPLLALLFIIPCLIFWNFGLKHYCSTGS